jgi:hypothetical protein
MSFHWTCPYCDRDTIITNTHRNGEFDLTIGNSVGARNFVYSLIVCPNPKCKKFTAELYMYKYVAQQGAFNNDGNVLQNWRLVPPSSAKVFPDYIPQPITDDYTEACLISDLSPKASATLSRRCLQGMIRDYWKVTKPRLVDEIEGIKDKVDGSTWAAIDAVRKIGNIGAHMESDINVIVDVDPKEAQLLIGLIEMLVKDWYIARRDREERLKEIIALADQKQDAKKGTPKAES